RRAAGRDICDDRLAAAQLEAQAHRWRLARRAPAAVALAHGRARLRLHAELREQLCDRQRLCAAQPAIELRLEIEPGDLRGDALEPAFGHATARAAVALPERAH